MRQTRRSRRRRRRRTSPSLWTACRRATTRRSDRKSTRLNSSPTEIYALSLHDALPIWYGRLNATDAEIEAAAQAAHVAEFVDGLPQGYDTPLRSEEHTAELQPHRNLRSFPTRRSSDLVRKIKCDRRGDRGGGAGGARRRVCGRLAAGLRHAA